jgi:hypothetical protein
VTEEDEDNYTVKSIQYYRAIESKRMMRWAGSITHMQRRRASSKRQLGRRTRRWEDDIQMDLKEIWEVFIGLI